MVQFLSSNYSCGNELYGFVGGSLRIVFVYPCALFTYISKLNVHTFRQIGRQITQTFHPPVGAAKTDLFKIATAASS
jgi:hypothetical protein